MSGRFLRLVVLAALVVVAAALARRSLARLEAAVPGGGGPASAAAPASTRASSAAASVRLVEVARGLDKPLFVTHAGDGSGRIFVVEQGGKIRILKDGRLLEAPFLDAARWIDTAGGERGLLGLAFAPDHARSGVFYVAHTVRGANRVVRVRRGDDPDRADPASARTILEMEDPAGNHNGGMIAFGPDGKLWIGTGDGGSGGDPWDNARDRRSLLGKMLRIAPTADGYEVPADNPFAGERGARGEIWALGLRNPWRFSFDRATGELWIGDVGQNAWEEIDVEDPREGGGLHYGWKTTEGRHCYAPRQGCDTSGLTLPIHEYGRDEGCSVTGGYVYRGRAIPGLAGHYLFSDYCNGTVWSLVREEGRAAVSTLISARTNVSSFGEDEAGELYLCDHTGSRVLKLVPAS